MKAIYKDKVFIVTGSTQGIGKEMVRQLLQKGAKVVMNGRYAHKEEDLLKEFSEYADQLLYVAADVTDASGSKQLIEKATQHFGQIDCLINNAGIAFEGDFERIHSSTASMVVDSVLMGSVHPTIAALPAIKESRGSIIFISSIAGLIGLPGASLYSMSKMALTGLTQSLRIELKDTGVHIGIAYVGFTENEATKMMFSPEGDRHNMPERRNIKRATRTHTAQRILNQYETRRNKYVHSTLGNFGFHLSRLFPRIAEFILYRYYSMKLKHAEK